MSCGGIRVALPATSRVVRTTRTEVIAASGDVAIAIIFDGNFARVTSAFGNPRVDEQDTDGFNAVYRIAWRRENGCELRAIALMPLSTEGRAMLMAVAGKSEPGLYIGSPRVPKQSALVILLDAAG